MRPRLVGVITFSVAVSWIVAASGCTPLASTGAVTPTTAGLPGASAAQGGEIAGPGDAPTTQSAATSPPPEPLSADSALSPAYDIYIGFNMGTRACDYETPGRFSRLAWVSAFHHVRFTAPPSGWSGETPFESELIGEDYSISELADYAYCWTWEGDSQYACFVTEGPNPFAGEVHVYVPSPEREEWEQRWMTVAPLASDALDQGQDLYLEYGVSYPEDAPPEKRIVIRAGDGHLGDCDMLGGPSMWLPRVIFPVPWQRIMKGEEFVQEFVGSAEDYEVWGDVPGLKWTVHFVPVEAGSS